MIQAKGDRGAARRLHELSDRRGAARAREIVHEQRAIAVRNVAVRIARRRQAPFVNAEQPVLARGGGDDHLLVRAVHASVAREVALEVHREPLRHPAGLVQVREERGRASEHVLRDAPPPARAIQMKDVRELVRDHERKPVIVVAKAQIIEWRMRVHDDAVRRERRRRSVREVDVVGNDEIDRPARLVQLRREFIVRPLGAHRRAARRRLELRCEVDVKVARVDRAPVRVRRHLRVAARDAQAASSASAASARPAVIVRATTGSSSRARPRSRSRTASEIRACAARSPARGS